MFELYEISEEPLLFFLALFNYSHSILLLWRTIIPLYMLWVMSMNTLLRTNTIIILILIITVKLHKEDCPEGPIGICTDPSRPPSESTWRARVGLLIAWPGFRGRCGGIGPQGFRGRCGGIREFTWLAHSHSCCLRQHAFTSLAYSRSCCLRQHAKDSEGGPEGCSTKWIK